MLITLSSTGVLQIFGQERFMQLSLATTNKNGLIRVASFRRLSLVVRTKKGKRRIEKRTRVKPQQYSESFTNRTGFFKVTELLIFVRQRTAAVKRCLYEEMCLFQSICNKGMNK